MVAELMGREKRQFGRRRTACHGWVRVKKQQRIACIVRNISKHGALLEFEGPPPAANRFSFMLDSHDFEAKCDVRHRSHNAVGVFFAEEISPQSLANFTCGNELVRKIRSELQTVDA